MSRVLLFPSRRRVAFIQSASAAAARYKRLESGAAYLQNLVDKHATRLRGIGVPEDDARRDVDELRGVLMGRLAALRSYPGRAGGAA